MSSYHVCILEALNDGVQTGGTTVPSGLKLTAAPVFLFFEFFFKYNLGTSFSRRSYTSPKSRFEFHVAHETGGFPHG